MNNRRYVNSHRLKKNIQFNTWLQGGKINCKDLSNFSLIKCLIHHFQPASLILYHSILFPADVFLTIIYILQAMKFGKVVAVAGREFIIFLGICINRKYCLVLFFNFLFVSIFWDIGKVLGISWIWELIGLMTLTNSLTSARLCFLRLRITFLLCSPCMCVCVDGYIWIYMCVYTYVCLWVMCVCPYVNACIFIIILALQIEDFKAIMHRSHLE